MQNAKGAIEGDEFEAAMGFTCKASILFGACWGVYAWRLGRDNRAKVSQHSTTRDERQKVEAWDDVNGQQYRYLAGEKGAAAAAEKELGLCTMERETVVRHIRKHRKEKKGGVC